MKVPSGAMWHRTPQVALLGLLFASFGCRDRAQERANDPHAWQDRGFEPCWIHSKRAYCGTVSSPWRASEPDQGAFDLHVVVLPAKSNPPKPDAVVFLAGGPGQAATEIGYLLDSLWKPLQRDRDIVFVDQRGTGSSAPLQCDFDDDIPTLAELFDIDTATELRLACLQDHLKRGFDLQRLSTAASADDLESVRIALGYTAFNVVGGSYGTRLGLTYAHRHPEHVRTLVLDGVAPPPEAIPLLLIEPSQIVFDQVFERCEADRACRIAFPELKTRAMNWVTQANEQPVIFDIPHPLTGQIESVTLSGDDVVAQLRSALYAPQLAGMIPWTLDQLIAGDARPLAGIIGLGLGTQSTMHVNLTLTIICSEELPRIDNDTKARMLAMPMGRAQLPDLERLCEHWPAPPNPNVLTEHVESSAPTLLLSGAHDPVTPPRFADAAGQHLSNADHVVVPNNGHGTLTDPCVIKLVTTIIEDPDQLATLDTSCMKDHGLPSFFIPPAFEPTVEDMP